MSHRFYRVSWVMQICLPMMLLVCVVIFIQLGFQLYASKLTYFKEELELVGSRRLTISRTNSPPFIDNKDEEKKFRILHVVTSLAEFNDGTRNTERGSDRLAETLIPTLKSSVESFIEKSTNVNWDIDVYLILGYVLKPERKQLIVDALPEGVGLEVWDDAIPLYYEKGEDKLIKSIPRALARQHRYVIKDKFDVYDLFSCWEDDMRITFNHVYNFLSMTMELEQLDKNAHEDHLDENEIDGSLSKLQLKNIIPGFIRVEVIQGDAKTQSESDKDPLQVIDGVKVDAKYCCRDSSGGAPPSENILLWETSVAALGVRKFPNVGWIAMLPGSKLPNSAKVPTYWSGADGVYGNMVRPGGSGNYFANAAGFMITRKQLDHLPEICPGGFLPPFVDNVWRGHNGLKPQNVEFWSGGYQLFGRCGLQRILPLEPDRFSKHLIYHTANNKQRQISRKRLVKANDLIGQLHAVKETAIAKVGSM